MMTTMHTTALAAYDADLQLCQHLSEQQRQALLQAALQKQEPTLSRQTRNQLVEDYLLHARRLVAACCPDYFRPLLPDLLAEVNLALVQAADRYQVQSGGNFRAYLSTCAEHSIKHAIGHSKLIRIPAHAFQEAKQQGTLDRLYHLQPVSLDARLRTEDGEVMEDLPVTPVLPSTTAPAHHPDLRTQVDDWLAHLPPRDELIMRMHYGLQDEDERAYTVTEIAQTLGLPLHQIRGAVAHSLRRLQTLATGNAIFVEKYGRRIVVGTRQITLSAEREVRFMQAAQQLCAQQIMVSSYTLAEATGMCRDHAVAFLKLHRNALPEACVTHRHEGGKLREQRVEQAYARLTEQGVRVTCTNLAKEAHTSSNIAAAFLRARKAAAVAASADAKRKEPIL